MTWKIGDPAPGWQPRTITPDCGHTVTVSGFAAGYATDRETGQTMCYACADDAQRATMATAAVVFAYVSTDGRTLTTWTGGTLARVTGHSVARTGFHGSKVHRYWAAAPDGSNWYGSNAGEGMAITVRRVKTSPAYPLPARVGPDSDGMLRPSEFSERFGELLSYSSTRDDRVATALTAREYIVFSHASGAYVRKPR